MNILEKYNLITDRTSEQVERLKTLSAKGWANLTDDERTEWLLGQAEPTYYIDGELLQFADGELLYIYDETGTNKGAYNYTDLNRVETVAGELSETLQSLPDELKAYAAAVLVGWDKLFDVPYDPNDMGLATKTDWAVDDIPTVADMTRYLDNVQTLRGAFEYETPDLPESMDKLGYSSANAIEQALQGLDMAISEFRAQIQEYIIQAALAPFYSGEISCGEA